MTAKSTVTLMLLVALQLAGCSEKQSKAAKTATDIASWVSTAEMLGEQWQRAAATDQLARQTLKRARQEITKKGEDLAKQSSVTAPGAQGALRFHIEAAEQLIDNLGRAVEQHNATTAGRITAQLAAEEQAIRTLGK